MGKKAVPKRNENSEQFKLSNAGSATECTGLITVPPENEDELENYSRVYDFGAFIDDDENDIPRNNSSQVRTVSNRK